MTVFRWWAAPAMLALMMVGAHAATGTPAVAASAAASTTANAPAAGGLLQVLFGLIVVLALLAGAVWLMKRFGMARGAGNSVIKIVGGVSVGNRERVLVLEVADQWIVVGVAAGRVNSLANLPRQEHAATADAGSLPASSFPMWLKQMIDQRNGKQ